MLIVALVLAVIGLAALVTAVVTNNEMIAWVCIGASGLGVLLLLVDAIRDRGKRRSAAVPAVANTEVIEMVEPFESTEVIAPVETTEIIEPVEPDYPESDPDAAELADQIAIEDHPEELVHDEPDYDMPSDDEADFPEPAEEAALHVVDDADDVDADDIDEQRYADGGDESATVVAYPEQPQSAETEYRYVESADTGITYLQSSSDAAGDDAVGDDAVSGTVTTDSDTDRRDH